MVFAFCLHSRLTRKPTVTTYSPPAPGCYTCRSTVTGRKTGEFAYCLGEALMRQPLRPASIGGDASGGCQATQKIRVNADGWSNGPGTTRAAGIILLCRAVKIREETRTQSS